MKLINSKVSAVFGLILWIGCVNLACAQAPPQAESAKSPGTGKAIFEVATVKPADGSGTIGFESFPGGRVAVGTASLKMLVSYAFNVTESQVVDKANWGNSTRYDVIMLPDADSPTRQQKFQRSEPNEEQRAMLRSLLEERFGLKSHIESREGPAYILALGKKKLML